MTRGDAAKLVTLILATWKAQASRIAAEDAKAMVDAYHMALEDLPSEVAGRALKRLMATRQFLPTPAEIRAAADEVTRGPARPAAEAWGDVVRAIGRWGRNRPPGAEWAPGEVWSFEDELVARAVDALGWEELCSSENRIADRARFIEAYGEIQQADRVEAVTMTLPGAAAPARLRGTTTIAGALEGAKQNLLGDGGKKR